MYYAGNNFCPKVYDGEGIDDSEIQGDANFAGIFTGSITYSLQSTIITKLLDDTNFAWLYAIVKHISYIRKIKPTPSSKPQPSTSHLPLQHPNIFLQNRWETKERTECVPATWFAIADVNTYTATAGSDAPRRKQQTLPATTVRREVEERCWWGQKRNVGSVSNF